MRGHLLFIPPPLLFLCFPLISLSNGPPFIVNVSSLCERPQSEPSRQCLTPGADLGGPQGTKHPGPCPHTDLEANLENTQVFFSLISGMLNVVPGT